MDIFTHQSVKKLFNILCWIQEKSLLFPKFLIFLVLILCGFSLYYTFNNLGFNTDTTEILSTDLPFHKNRLRFLKSFPQDDLVVPHRQRPEELAVEIIAQIIAVRNER